MEIQLWKKILTPYELAVQEILVKFNHIIMEYRSADMYSPIETVNGRVKSISSILEKCRKKNIPLEIVTEKVEDIAGIRVICSFPDDIYKLVDCLLAQDDITLIEKKDYITNPKKSGYRSYHLIIEVPIFLIMEKKPMRVEVHFIPHLLWFCKNIRQWLSYFILLAFKFLYPIICSFIIFI